MLKVKFFSISILVTSGAQMIILQEEALQYISMFCSMSLLYRSRLICVT